ncbi:hypothetical protein [Rhizobium phaseoli]|uniref:Cap15 family cyclic dinucleotide receptor domain-containing protein n=1 Tax=Rhizobium phaseoli TaxID=396 RepID=UPI000BE9A3D1|nr:hypothetical protein [Rhizobium phaseoli]PDS31317.1 hypothetical protein CO650_11045 [Rhizobium phaseoli]
MFRIINFTTLIRSVAIATTILTLLIYAAAERWLPQIAPSIRVFSIGPWVALMLTFAITSRFTSRAIWGGARFVSGSLYPDLNGVWLGEIQPNTGSPIEAAAVIRQALLNTEIDLHTPTTKSLTLEATPAMSAGQYKLYYTYQAKPKQIGWSAYTGSTIFDVRTVNDNGKATLELSGFYYTERETKGRIRLRQVGIDPNKDVSYY